MLKTVNPKSRPWTCFALLAIVAACGGDPEERDWQSTMMKRSAEGYEQFLEQYPEGAFSQKAREALESVHFKQVQKDNTLEAVEGFLKRHPDAERSGFGGRIPISLILMPRCRRAMFCGLEDRVRSACPDAFPKKLS